MKSILEQLYNGEIYPYLTFKTTIEQYKVERDKAFQSYSIFLEKLPEDLKEEFVKLIDDHLDLLPFELEQSFIDGFRIGVRLMSEAFSVPFEEHNTQPE